MFIIATQLCIHSCTKLVPKVLLKRAFGTNELHVSSIPANRNILVQGSNSSEIYVYALQNLLLFLQLEIITFIYVGESPLFRNNDLLSSRELVTCTTKSFHDNGCSGIFASDGEDNLANVHTCNCPVRFAPSSAHTRLQSNIKSSVNAQLILMI